ncbi:MAG TPA: DMT family transporter [Chitinophagales bacterium]|nr:DMT family transporter [Chitinophagales bacterium]
MSNTTSPHNAQNWILLALLTLIWGTSYILIKKSLLGFTAIELACLRISISCVVALPFAIKGLKTIPRSKYPVIFLVGIFGSGAPAFLFSLSMTKSGSAINGILNSLSPLWTLVIGYYLYKVAISAQKVWGVIIGFVGALVLVLGKGTATLQIDVLYSFLPVIATFCYGMSSNLTKQKLQNQNAIYTTALAMASMGLPVLVGLFFTEAPAKIASGTVWFPFACVAALSIVGTLIAWMLFYRLVQRTDALFAASVTYLIPIVAIGWGVMDNEVLSLIQIAGMVLILVGVYFTTRTTPGLSAQKGS